MALINKEIVNLVQNKFIVVCVIALTISNVWTAKLYIETNNKYEKALQDRVADQKLVYSYGIELAQLYRELNRSQEKQIHDLYGLKNIHNSDNADSPAFPIERGTRDTAIFTGRKTY